MKPQVEGKASIFLLTSLVMSVLILVPVAFLSISVLFTSLADTADKSDVEDDRRNVSAAPLGVQLANFSATCEPSEAAVHISWETITERDNLSFNLYRSPSPEMQGELLTQEMIPTQTSDSGQGAVYNWLDSNIENDNNYTYWLESIDIYGNTTLMAPANSDCKLTATQLPSLEIKNDIPFILYMALVVQGLGMSVWKSRRK